MNLATVDTVTTVKSAFNFSVDKFPLSGPDGMSTKLYGLFRSDNSECISRQSVTKSYVPHTTDDVLALVEAGQEAFDGEIKVDCHFNRGHFVNLAPTNEDRVQIFGNKDAVFPRIIISAGYDGRSFKATMGYYRDLCDNLSMLKQVEGTTVSIRHSSGLRSKMDDLVEQFQTLKESWSSLTTVIQGMQAKQVILAEFLDAVYGSPEATEGRGATIHRNRTSSILNRILSERQRSGRGLLNGEGKDIRVSAWEAYNGIQGNVQWNASRKGNPSDFSRILSAMNDPAVKRAEALALAM